MKDGWNMKVAEWRSCGTEWGGMINGECLLEWKNDLRNEWVCNGGQYRCFIWWMGLEWKIDWYMLEHVVSLSVALGVRWYICDWTLGVWMNGRMCWYLGARNSLNEKYGISEQNGNIAGGGIGEKCVGISKL